MTNEQLLSILRDAVADAGGVKNFECANDVYNVSAMLNVGRRVSIAVALALGYRRTKDGYEKLTQPK